MEEPPIIEKMIMNGDYLIKKKREETKYSSMGFASTVNESLGAVTSLGQVHQKAILTHKRPNTIMDKYEKDG